MKICLCWATLVATMVALVCPASPAHAQTAAAGPSIALIDLGEVFTNHQRLQAQLEDIKKDAQAFEAYVRDQQTKAKSMADQLKTLRADSTDYSTKEKALASLQADMNVQLRQKGREFQEREARIRYNAYQETVEQVSRFAQQYGIKLVIRFSREPIDPEKPQSVVMGLSRPVVYQNQLDITDHIIALLNPPGTAPAAASRTPQIPARRR